MKLATWNVNSVVARHDRVLAWLERYQPDVLCLQELKCTDEKFPHVEVRSLGYQAAVFGQKTYNGVAILARGEITDVHRGLDPELEGEDARLISGVVDGVRIIDVYVPNGQSVDSDKFTYKLEWLSRLKDFLGEHHRTDEALVVCGDFNCAPTDELDVAKVEQWKDTVLTHDKVRSAVRDLEAWGLTDAFRAKYPETEKYSWWDYRRLGFPKGNGLRIDLALATDPIMKRLTEVWIDREERKGKKPSDHVPVVVELE